MSKLILFAFAATVFWMSTSQAQLTGGKLVCQSVTGAYTECEAGVSVANPTVETEYSRPGTCLLGTTWGYFGSKIWVDRYCRAEFSFDTNGGQVPPPPRPGPTPRPPAYQVVDCRFNSQNWQPYYKPYGRFIGRPNFGFQDANTCVYDVQQSVSGSICNWTGNGFTPYDMESNIEVNYGVYGTIEACYASVPYTGAPASPLK